MQDISINLAVPAVIGVDDLRDQCISAMMLKWHQWSKGYHLPVGEVEIRHKGVLVSGDSDCILQYYSKKTRSAATKTYNFSLVLDFNLVINNKFYQEVSGHMDQEFSVLDGEAPEVSWLNMIMRIFCSSTTGHRISNPAQWIYGTVLSRCGKGLGPYS